MAERQSFWTGWQERISALANVPAVLKIVWDSGPAVVVFGLVSRLLSSLLPVALLWITKLIIDGIVHAVSTHQPVQPGFWWLVAAEFALAVLNSILVRTIDYSDSLLADKYTRHVMIQAIGRLVQQAITPITLSISIMFFSPWLMLLLIAGVVPAFLGESHFAFLGY